MNYGTANDINDASSRIECMSDTGVTLANYQYLGTSGFVDAASAQRSCPLSPAFGWPCSLTFLGRSLAP